MEIEIGGHKVLIDEEDYQKVKNINIKVSKIGYAYFCNKSTTGNDTDLLHRYIMGLSNKDGYEVDHINGNTYDNRRVNLRKCRHFENSRNLKLNKRNKLKIKGVCYDKDRKKYASFISLNGKTIGLGRYDTAEEAHKAYCEASKKYHGEFGRTE